ncbi:MAG: T9SS type A sorting domain-containing protein [Lewinellaceae bacterium]|nr:T9SS type A sorting domain-containing protein [Lewinellaceae bacterium]
MKAILNSQFWLLVLLFSYSNASAQLLAQWSFENIATAVPSLPIAASSYHSQVSGAYASLSGGNNTGSPAVCSGNESWATNFWPSASSRDPGEFLEFSITAQPGYTFTVTAISFSAGISSSNGASAFDVYVDVGNGEEFAFSGSTSIGCGGQAGSFVATTSVGGTITVRIYPYLQNPGALAATFRLDDVTIQGLAALPVTLVDFRGRRQPDGTINLIWKTDQERNNAYFAVERASAQNPFTEIGRVRGVGTSYLPQTYFFTDQAPHSGINYYRLRQVDTDGKAIRHPAISVDAGSEPTPRIYPLPTQENITIYWPATEVSTQRSWRLVHTSGAVIQSGTMPPQTPSSEIPLADLPAGIYFLQLISRDQRFMERILKL